MALKNCPRCGKEFAPGQDGHWKAAIYCSRRCRALQPRGPLSCALAPTDAAYLAGLLDGEGSIVALKRSDGTTKSYRAIIVNTHIPVLEWCQTVTGIGVIGFQARKAHYRPCGAWTVCGVRAASVLSQLLPYLKIKREKAVDAVERMRP